MRNIRVQQIKLHPADSDFALTGVGLLYQRGYLEQSLNPDGWQQERTPLNDFYTLPVRPCLDERDQEILVSVNLPNGEVFIKLWYIDVGRVKLYLLDTNVPHNKSAEHREITDQLYGGDIYKRIRQEIVLGIGGLRALRKLGIKPTVHHMNEGHSAFLGIERARILMQENGLSFEQALEATRLSNVFTTHTSVPAGIDLFDSSMVYDYFHAYCEQANIPFEKLLALGRKNLNDPAERFSMAVLGAEDIGFPERGQCAAPFRFTGDVPGSLAAAARGRDSYYLGNERSAFAKLDQWRLGGALRSVSAARLARSSGRRQNVGACSGDPNSGALGDAPQT